MYDRFQTLPVNSTRSDPVKLPRGVPRGSVLQPVLFTLYNIPLASNIYRHNLNHRFYANNSDHFNSALHGTIFQDKASITVLKATKAMNRRNRQTKKKRTAIVCRTAVVSSPHLQHRNSEQSSSAGPSSTGPQWWAVLIYTTAMVSSPHLHDRNGEQSSSTRPQWWAVLIYRTAMVSSPHLHDRNGEQSSSTGPQWWAVLIYTTAMMSISRGTQWWAYLEDRNGEQSTSTKLQREQIIITIIMMIIDNFCILLFSGVH